MMLVVFFVLLHLHGPVSTTAPEVSCLIVNLDFVECHWNATGILVVNWTFHSRFKDDDCSNECSNYLLENDHVVGCRQPYKETKRFRTFYTNLTYEDSVITLEHDLKTSVKMNPPSNLSLENSSGHELWLYWNNSKNNCMENEVRYRTDSNSWKESHIFDSGRNSFSVPQPSQSRRYEFQVRTRVADYCHGSRLWSEWSTIIWGPITDPSRGAVPIAVWTPMVSVVAALVLLLLVCLLLHNERLRVILIPIVPNPAKNPVLSELLDTHNGNVEEWLHISKELKEGFKPHFNERACSVREYTSVPLSSPSESTASITTDQSDSSVSISTDQSGCLSTFCSSSTSTLLVTSGEEQAGPE